MKLLLVNPNTSQQTTDVMLHIARAAAPAGVTLIGATAPFGSPLIVNEAHLATAAEAVDATLAAWAASDLGGVIIAAFGDPGLASARRMLSCPVTGIAEAGMAEAAAGRRRLAVVTTTPDLVDSIAAAAARYGHERLFRGVWLTIGEPEALMADPERLELSLEYACRRAGAAGAEAVVIGGGPLARAAQAIGRRLAFPIIEPIPAAVRLAVARAAADPSSRGRTTP